MRFNPDFSIGPTGMHDLFFLSCAKCVDASNKPLPSYDKLSGGILVFSETLSAFILYYRKLNLCKSYEKIIFILGCVQIASKTILLSSFYASVADIIHSFDKVHSID